jgi:hypothetical protein
MNNCKHCNKETTNKHFCSMSCSASFNNKGVRRHGKDPINCHHCGKETRNKKYCSNSCQAKERSKYADRKLSNRLSQSRYRAKGYREIHPDANPEKIRQIYKNCPEGYEVDHIIPLSLGGWHHEDNLQCLTILENRTKGNRYIG